MRGASTSSLLIIIGVILYLIIQISFYVLIILAVTGIIALIILAGKSLQGSNGKPPKTNSKAIENNTHHQDNRIISESQHKQLKALIAAHGTTPSIDTSQMIITELKLVEKFYTSRAYVRMDLFDYMIESTKEKLKYIEPRHINGKVAKQFAGILYEVEALKGHIAIKTIVAGYNLKFNQSEIISDSIDEEQNRSIQNDIVDESMYALGETERISIESQGYIFTTREVLRQEEEAKKNAIAKEKQRVKQIETKQVAEFEQKIKLIKERRLERLKELEAKKESNLKNTEITSEDDNSIIDLDTDVPYWQHYYVYSADGLADASMEQRDFYKNFKLNFLNGIYLDIKENYNYAFILLFDLIDDYQQHKDLERIQNELKNLGEHYPKTARYTQLSLNKVIRANEATKKIEYSVHIDTRYITHTVSNNTATKYKTEEKIQKCKWIPYGEIVEVNGNILSRGGFYIGEKYSIPAEYRDQYGYFSWHEKTDYIIAPIINPQLEVSRGDNEITYFSGYQDMRPVLRGHYMQWLSQEIDDEHIPIELFNLYFLGLELRMFIDSDTTMEERKHILKDIIRFREIFQDNYGCRYKLSDFIDNTITKYFKENPLDFVRLEELTEFRTYRAYNISKYITDDVLDCQSAYQLGKLLYPDLNIPSKFEEIAQQMFSEAFNKRYKTGLSIKKNENNFNYHVRGDRFVNDGSYMYKPDSYYYLHKEILKLNFSNWEVENAIRECYDVLYRGFYGYSKILKDNNGSETLEAIFLLPKQINVSTDAKIIALNSFLTNAFSDSKYPVIDVNSLLKLWDYNLSESSLPKRIIDSIQNAFDEMGYGIEPDYRVHGARFKQYDKCVLFTKNRKSPIKPDNLYSRMQATIKMAVIVAQADGEISDAERSYTLKHIAVQVGNPNKIKYLSANLKYLSLSKQKYTNFKQYPLLFDKQSIESTHNFLVRLACADGEINNKEIEAITKIMGYFGVDCSDIHSKIHRIFTGEDDVPILVAKESGATNYVIPKPDEVVPEFSIDMNKLSLIEHDTKKSKVLLSDIFVSQEDSEKPAISSQQSKLSEILAVLLTKESWNRNEVVTLCSQQNMMIGFVLESLNDISYDAVDDAVIDDAGEMIYVTTQYKDQLICQNQ